MLMQCDCPLLSTWPCSHIWRAEVLLWEEKMKWESWGEAELGMWGGTEWLPGPGISLLCLLSRGQRNGYKISQTFPGWLVGVEVSSLAAVGIRSSTLMSESAAVTWWPHWILWPNPRAAPPPTPPSLITPGTCVLQDWTPLTSEIPPRSPLLSQNKFMQRSAMV
jgi:hypothetical protein